MLSKEEIHVMIAPLNWGLGPASRCIPIARYLLANNYKVTFASDGEALSVLKTEFPDANFEELPSYRVSYSKSDNFRWKLVTQIPHIFKVIHEEKKATEELVRKYRITHIISDNRYGCYDSYSYNSIISHQLKLYLYGWWKIWSLPLDTVIRSWLQSFDEVWVPDSEDATCSGSLSSLGVMDKYYIGPLSRMTDKLDKQEQKYPLVIVLSGPEPQRSLFEEKVRSQLSEIHLPCILVRGIPGSSEIKVESPSFSCVDFLGSQALNALLLQADYIVCRSGYSSIMDLMAIGKSALYIPTPGQTEQEYLAERFKEHGYPTQEQDALDIKAYLDLPIVKPVKIEVNSFEKQLLSFLNKKSKKLL